MRIGIDASRAVTTQRTGTENYSLYLIRALLSRAPQGYHFTLYSRQPVPAGLFGPAANYATRVLCPPRLWSHLGLAREVWRRPPDVLLVPAHVLPLLCRVPAVVVVHDLGYLHEPETYGWRERLYLRWGTAHSTRRARTVITVSESTRQDVIAHLGVPPERVHTVHPGVAPHFWKEVPSDRAENIKQRYGVVPPYLLYAGSLKPRKNLPRLLEAYLQATAGRPEAPSLVLAGRKQPLGARFDELLGRADGRVVVTGYVPDEDLPALMQSATAFVMPSLFEGFGLPVLEAMASGTPVLASTAGSLPEVAGEAALLVAADDVDALAAAIRRMLDDEDLRRQLVARGRVRAQAFTWERAAEATLTLLEEAADVRQPHAEGLQVGR